MRHGTWQAGGVACVLALGTAMAWGQASPATMDTKPGANADDLVVTTPTRLTYAFGGNNANTVTWTQFTGTYTAPLDGEVTLFLMDPAVPVTATGYIPLSVRDAILIGSSFTPANNIIPDPLVMHLDPGQPSRGWFHPRTGSVFMALYLVDGCYQQTSQMPVYLRGRLSRSRLVVSGCNQNAADDQLCLSIAGRRSSGANDIRFSTEISFPVPGDDTGNVAGEVSDGDLLSDRACVLRTAEELASRLGIMPPTPDDLGLDAITLTAYTPTLFSLERNVFSETLGPISDGDLLSVRGQIIRTNAELTAPFGPMPPAGGYGLDAVHVKTSLVSFGNVADCCGDILFSIETSFWSESQGRYIGHGDMLCEDGTVVRTNRQLLANFHPIAVACTEADCPTVEIPCPAASTDARCRDLGLDGLAVLPHGEILFSVERSFRDANLGWVSDGDLLSARGAIVRRNLRLVDACEPLIDIDNFGLDGIDVIGRWNFSSPADASPAASPVGTTAP